jgi:hypothetical protein
MVLLLGPTILLSIQISQIMKSNVVHVSTCCSSTHGLQAGSLCSMVSCRSWWSVAQAVFIKLECYSM